ncbi:DUF1853 family protein [Reichenbachiella versicolor]|uniref:DUF1853 family protein n=1 Tax=Reichenbachiella versicolor TaxID=1821036 RepID=UPI000D6E4976|nr:DUF1853 family protein [Reichenbachiella versicolor]
MMNNIDKRVTGYLNTSVLWRDTLQGLQQYQPNKTTTIDTSSIASSENIRLGKLTEQFVLAELERDPSLEVMVTNLQVFKDRVTIGELDCLLKTPNECIHLEIVYKFYLYDPSIPDELSRWIGPNRKDSLVFKLAKLKEKQLPLLYHPETQNLLQELGIGALDFEQQVYFKAQLFVPYHWSKTDLPLINNECIIGYYLRPDDLTNFSDFEFYIPNKLDWLIEPHLDVKWMSIDDLKKHLYTLHSNQVSPMCWVKTTDAQLQKLFIVWW